MIPFPHWLSRLPLTFVGPLLVATSAPAAVIYSGVLNIPIPTTFNGVYLDIAAQTNSTPANEAPTIGTDNYTVGYNQPSGWHVNFFFGGIGIAYSNTFQPFVDDPVGNRSQILNVTMGTVIVTEADSRTLGTAAFGGSGRSNRSSGDSHFDVPVLDADPAYAAFTPGEQGYIAFVLNPGVNELYGWLRVTLDHNLSDGSQGFIHDWAYSDQAGFTVGQIPEPGAATLLLAAAIGLPHRRRAWPT